MAGFSLLLYGRYLHCIKCAALIAVFLVLLVNCVGAEKSYSLRHAYVLISIQENGNVHITEKITYDLQCDGADKFNELYLQKPPGLKIMNAQGHCEGVVCSFRVDEPGVSVTGERELINRLVGGGCGTVTAVFDYDIKAITMYPDTAQFYYKVWGDKWDKPVPLDVEITIPGSTKEAIYFIHYDYSPGQPQDRTEKNKVIIHVPEQPANKILEINLLMPKDWFNESGDYYYVSDMSRKDIIKIEEQTMRELEFKRKYEIIIFAFVVAYALSPLAAVAIAYVIFGRELSPEEAGYTGVYEQEPPQKIGPAECIFFITMNKDYDEEALANALSATIVSLVNKGALDVQEKEISGLFGKTKDAVFAVKEPVGMLRDYELALFDYLKRKAINGEVSMRSFASSTGATREFYNFTRKWLKTVGEHIEEKKYADMRGFKLAEGFLILHMLVSFFIAFLSSCMPGLVTWAGFGGVIVDVLLITVVSSRKNFWGRWTREGRVLNLKWENFKKYLSDFSALEEHPIESVKLWDYYMEYAVALGVAEKAIQSMKKIRPTWVKESRCTYLYSNVGALSMLRSSVSPAYQAKGGSGGGFGGGFGGGGGGGGGGAR
ncbi:MAG: DUF2207 domain-containing protein [Candidatus Micrarchaeota archaeon]|nr:DUF2207 domain-containing protein [Candidatus Micrarchaeota archaeon]